MFAFKLAAVFDVIAFGELYRRIDTLLDVVYHTSEVTVRHVGGNHDFALHVFAVDRVRSHGRNHFRHIVQRHFAAVVGVYH